MIGSLLQVFGSLSSGSYSWDISSSLLDAFRDFLSIEDDRHVEERETEHEQEIDDDVDPARIIHAEVIHEEFSYFPTSSSGLLLQHLSDERGEGDDGDGEDDRNHSCLIDSDREV